MQTEVALIAFGFAAAGWVYLRVGRWHFERKYGRDPDLPPELNSAPVRPAWYWSDMRKSGGMPFAYTGIDGGVYRSLQTGIWGVQIGTIFVGVIRGHRDPGLDRK